MTLQWFSSWPSAALRGQKEVAVAVAVLRGPPCPPWTNVLPLQFFVFLRGPSWTKGSCSRRCSSPRPSVSSVDKCVAVAVLRVPGPSWTKGSCSRRCSSPRPSVSSVDKCVAVAVLRVPSRPFVDKRKLQSPLQFSAALRVLRGQMLLPLAVPLQFFALRGPSWTKGSCSSPRPSVSSVDKCVAVAVLRVPSWPFVDKRKLQSPLQFSAALRVLRGQMCCRCSSSCSFAALRGQKEVAVAVAVLRGPPCPPWTNVLPLQFFVFLRGPSWTKGSCSRRCSSPRPSVSSVDKCVAVAVLRGSSAALRGQKEVAVAVAVLRGPPCPPWTNVLPLQFFVFLRGPSWTKGSCSRRCSSPRPSVSSVDKCVAVAVLRVPFPPSLLDKPYSHITVHSRTTSITDETRNWNRWNSCIIMA